MSEAHNVELVRGFWAALYARDWDAIAGHFGPDSVYWDVPVGPTAAGKGPADIVSRLKLGLEGLAGYEQYEGPIVAQGDLVVTEHREVWHWPTGETASLPFVSVMTVVDGVITVWKDYWDYNTLWQAAPESWHERLLTADLSWAYDASGDGLAP
ncbi:MAG TPA: nuclear transport factor 2 family protein [Mycobacteriales bacterium]|nr:nuclear transport factor 2 family protein [Mycobacteriales bacterium]